MTTLASGSSVTFGLAVDQTFEMTFADGTTGTITVTGPLGSPYRTTFGPAKKNNWNPLPLGTAGRVVVACTAGSVSYTLGTSSFLTAVTDAVTGDVEHLLFASQIMRITAYDANGRPDRVVVNGETYTVTYDANGLPTKVGTPAPWLYATTEGPTQYLHNAVIRGYAVSFGSKIYAISQVDRKCYVYSAGVWALASAAIDAGAGIFHLFFADSRGYLFASWGPNSHAGAQKLYRSIDGGVNWTTVLDSTYMPGGDDYLGSMTEADNGYLFASVYNDVDGAGTAARKLLKSIDGGTNWTDISTAALAATTYTRHFHSVYFCPYRLALFASGGDNGTPSKIIVSTDYGVTWTAWAQSFQATAMVSDADFVYYCSDVSGDHSIYRAAGTTAAEIIAATPFRTFTNGTGFTPVSPITNGDGTEFAWWGTVDDQGNIIFPYGKGARAAMIISGDQGASWVDGLTNTAASTTQYSYEPQFCSHYLKNKSPFFFGSINGAGYARKWRAYKSPVTLEVNASTGDDVFGDGVNTPFATIPEVGVKANAIVALTADYTPNATLGLSGLLLHRGSYQLGTAVSGTLTIDETFEGTSSLTTSTTGGGTASQTDTTNPKFGTRCARVTTSGAANDTGMVQKANALSGVAQGTEIWLAGWYYITAASLTSNAILQQMQSAVSIMVDTTANGGGLYAQLAVNSNNYKQHADDYTALTLGAWHYIKSKIKYHATLGEITIWCDGKRVLNVRGVNTYNAGALHCRFGLLSSMALTCDVDNVKIALGFDPDKPPALVLNGSAQAVIPDMIFSSGVKTW